MSLTAYRSNRVFAKTREPVGRVRRGNRSRQYIVVGAGGNTQIDFLRGNNIIAFSLD
jgi:hypothetical protein